MMNDAVSWSSALRDDRDAIGEVSAESHENDWLAVTASFTDRQSLFLAQLRRYNDRPHAPNPSSDKEETKELIVETRSALRWAVLFLSVEHDAVRRDLQAAAVDVAPLLAGILQATKGDAKCRLYAGRLLSNLVTSNATTAAAVSSTIHIAPTPDAIQARIRESVSDMDGAPRKADDCNWVDLLLASSRTNRETLAATCAALHNCLAALGENSDYNGCAAGNSLLVSTLLRQAISVESIKATLETDVDHADAATDWISLLVVRWYRSGLLRPMYSALGANDKVLPEQLVLLHCLLSDSEAPSKPAASDSLLFLAELYTTIRDTVVLLSEEDETALERSALLTILDILGNDLASGDKVVARARQGIGALPFFRSVALDLGQMTDTLNKRHQNVSSREASMSDAEQHWMTAWVRVVGNLCFRCGANQDFLRTLEVAAERSALHALLSCTSVAHACFTLREWAVVAIRHALEENDENQAVVEKLQAQQPAQSAQLDDMGIRIDMKQGKVSVRPSSK